MKLRGSVVFAGLVSLTLLLALLLGHLHPTVAQEQAPTPARPSVSMPQNTGGPDDYGYTWDDAGPPGWIDAVAGGTDTGLSGYAYKSGPVLVSLPFPFKYYENTYSYVYIHAAGLVGFTSRWSNWQNQIPRPTEPNNILAPYWSQDIYLNATGPSGRVYTKSGGAAPNRYFVVEWYDVRGGDPSDALGGDDVFRFEVILYENSAFDFQYQTMTYTGDYRCYTGAGIEDSTGLDGLLYLDGSGLCVAAPANVAVRFTRPTPAARVSLKPLTAGAFGAPGNTVEFRRTIRNTGDRGADTYDLFPGGSWPLTLYSQDSITPLTDTDGDGALDTGAVAQGWFRTIVIKIRLPAGATIGQSSAGQLGVQSSIDTSQSKVLTFRVAVPAMFAQSYTLNGSPYTGIYRPTGPTAQTQLGSGGYNPAVVTTPDGNLVQVWSQSRVNANKQPVRELYVALLDQYGGLRQPAAIRITDQSSAVLQTYDYAPALAVTPDGAIGVTWYRTRYDSSNGAYNYNIFYLILNSAGGIVAPATDLTHNAAWGAATTPNVPHFYSPAIAATPDNRLIIAWQRRVYTGVYTDNTLWYVVQAANGSPIKAPTLFNSDLWSQDPNLAPLADGSVFLSQYRNGQIAFGRINSSGTILTSLTNLTSDGGNHLPDAVQLLNGNLVITWKHWTGLRYIIGYAVLNSSLVTLNGPLYFPAMSPLGDDSPAITYFGNRAALTWGDACCDYQPNLYYALLDGSGNSLTPPMIFASDNTYYNLQLPYNGQGNTWLPGASDRLPPTNPTSLTSADHAVNVWSNDNTVNVAWSGASDTGGSGLNGYAIAWDTSLATVPAPNLDVGATLTNLTSAALPDGSGYFHIRAIDGTDNAAAGAAHFGPFKIDTHAPTNPISLTSSDHAVNVWSNDNTINVAWSGAADTGGSDLDGYSVLWDTAAASVPDAIKDLEEPASSATSAAQPDGNRYFHIRAIDAAGNVAPNATHLGPFLIDTLAPQSTALSPDFVIAPFIVQWRGADSGSGLDHYRLEVRDGLGGWTTWLTNTSALSATYATGLANHTYYFRSVAIDRAGNVEAAGAADGDTRTTVAAFRVTGAVINNRHQPVFNATVSTDPAALNPAKSDGAGHYTLYLAAPDTYSLIASRSDFGALPPLTHLAFDANTTAPDLVLPPLSEAVTNGHWETGDLSGWSVDPAITPTLETTAAHTGNFGLRLTTGMLRPSGAAADFTPAITQTIHLSATQRVLSWLYRVTQGSGDPFIVAIAGDTEVITHELSVTPTEWTHAWVDLAPFAGQALTISLGFQNTAVVQQIDLDEISLGATQIGVYTVSLPVVRR